jgi:hypothetical protein
MANKKSIGLPGGPNEYITHVSEMFSTEGYKRNSPDVNNPVNIIESSNITMNGVDFPVRGYGNNGKVQDMMPGVEHYDYGNADYVVEVPMAQTGVEVEKSFEITPELLLKQAFVESLLNPKAKNDLGYKGIAQIGDDLISDYKKANKVESVDPFNAQQNHDVQEWSMNELYNSSFVDKPTSTAENRLLKSLASYNWGRGKVLKLLTEEKANGTDIYTGTDWTEKLPQQTKDYINMIVYDGSTEKRPLVQENFIKATKDDKYKEIRDIYTRQYLYKLVYA